MKWFRRAAEKGDADGEARLGYLLVLGIGTAADREEGMRLLRSADAKGNALARRLLDLLHMDPNPSIEEMLV